ncbi:MAG: hypothetical protein HYU68_02495 [Bacteroidetes bacterium]|nr:hypothetical protein [Bacteroidota bacterium]
MAKEKAEAEAKKARGEQLARENEMADINAKMAEAQAKREAELKAFEEAQAKAKELEEQERLAREKEEQDKAKKIKENVKESGLSIKSTGKVENKNKGKLSDAAKRFSKGSKQMKF